MKREINESYIPMGSGRYAEKSLWNEFWTDFIHIFSAGGPDVIGIIFAVGYSLIFILRWLFFLIERFILKLNVKKPEVKKN